MNQELYILYLARLESLRLLIQAVKAGNQLMTVPFSTPGSVLILYSMLLRIF